MPTSTRRLCGIPVCSGLTGKLRSSWSVWSAKVAVFSCCSRAGSRDGARVRRVPVPAISTGVYGYPLALVAKVAIGATRRAPDAYALVVEARFWLFDERAYDVFSGVGDT